MVKLSQIIMDLFKLKINLPIMKGRELGLLAPPEAKATTDTSYSSPGTRPERVADDDVVFSENILDGDLTLTW